ncbi:MAG: hypothetical protein AB1938_31145, partial [Myxococcota bacterium]
MRSFVLSSFVLLAAACGVDSTAELADFDDEVELDAAELNAAVLLAFVNAGTTTVEVLTLEATVEARAAKNVVARRDGPDATFGTADDRSFASIAELDAVPYVGPVALTGSERAWETQGDVLGAAASRGLHQERQRLPRRHAARARRRGRGSARPVS